MPKIPEGEWRDSLDPESEEYSPDMEQIKHEDRVAAEIEGDLFEINRRIGKKDTDYYKWEEDKYSAQDPEFMWEELYYLEKEISKIGDTIEREKLLAQLREVEQRVYRQYIPFIDAKINVFGWQESPLEEKYGKTHFLSCEEIESYFRLARDMAAKFVKTEEEKTNYESELDRLSERLGRYKKEPTIFSFEIREEELQREIGQFREFRFESMKVPIKDKAPLGAFDNEEARQQNIAEIQALIEEAIKLEEITHNMQDPESKEKYKKRAESLRFFLERMQIEVNSPLELIKLEANLKDLYVQARAGEKISHHQLAETRERLKTLEEKWIDLEQVKRLEKLLEKIERAMRGEVLDDEDEDRIVQSERGSSWAWEVLGIKRAATIEEARRAYKQLARKFHPDRNSSPEASERMKDINEAFSFVEKVLEGSFGVGIRIG